MEVKYCVLSAICIGNGELYLKQLSVFLMFILYSVSFSFPWTVGVFQTADQVGSMAELAGGPAPSSGS